LLLLKKKKYAALKIENPGRDNQTEVKEVKGLDLVRRDWCMLSKRVGNYVLDQVMSGKPKEEIQLALNDFLSDIGQKLKSNQLNISEYIITKQLTKMPDQY
jgi:DNA polymerase alpha subunit A